MKRICFIGIGTAWEEEAGRLLENDLRRILKTDDIECFFTLLNTAFLRQALLTVARMGEENPGRVRLVCVSMPDCSPCGHVFDTMCAYLPTRREEILPGREYKGPSATLNMLRAAESRMTDMCDIIFHYGYDLLLTSREASSLRRMYGKGKEVIRIALPETDKMLWEELASVDERLFDILTRQQKGEVFSGIAAKNGISASRVRQLAQRSRRILAGKMREAEREKERAKRELREEEELMARLYPAVISVRGGRPVGFPSGNR